MRNDWASTVVKLADSETHERTWYLVHTAQGPLLVGVWYRPPKTGEALSVQTLEQEWSVHSENAVGTLIVGDINVHSQAWLKHHVDHCSFSCCFITWVFVATA